MFKDHGTGGLRDMHKICQKKISIKGLSFRHRKNKRNIEITYLKPLLAT